jgi:Tol biopolymer transport system component
MVGVIVLALAAGVWWYRREVSLQRQSATVTPASVDRPLRRLTFDSGLQTDVTFSPDGRAIAYASDHAGNFDIWVQSLDGGEPQQLTRSPSQETQPAWSPDGNHIVFRSEQSGGGLFRIPAGGGPETQLTSFGAHPVWSPDGSEVLFRAGVGGGDSVTGMYAVSSGGGEPSHALAPDFLRGAFWLWIAPHPDGRVSAVGLHPGRRFGFYTVSRDGKQVVKSTVGKDLPLQPSDLEFVLRFQWNHAGTAVYLEVLQHDVRNIWRVRVDPATLEWLAAERLTTGSSDAFGAALSRDGKQLAFSVQRRLIQLWSYPLDAATGRIVGSGVAITPEDVRATFPTLSPDGRFVTYAVTRPGSNRLDLMLTEIDGKKTQPFGLNASVGAWSPDSRTFAYATSRTASVMAEEAALATRDVGGAERIIRKSSKDSAIGPTGWTPDARHIVGSYASPILTGTPKVAFVSPIDGSHDIVLEDPARALWQASVSRDGWIAFVSVMVDNPTRVEVYVARPRTRAAEWTTIASSHQWSDKPRWSPNGRMLYFTSRERTSFLNLWAVRFDPDRGAAIGDPFPVTRFDSPDLVIWNDGATGGSEIGISARRAVFTAVSAKGSIWVLENVDW